MARKTFKDLIDEALAEHMAGIGDGRRQAAELLVELRTEGGPAWSDHEAARRQCQAGSSDRIVIMLIRGGLRKLMV